MHEHGAQTETKNARPLTPGDALRSIPHPDVVTSVIQHQVKPGTEAQYEAWLREITPTAQRFPGHQGANIIRPPEGTGPYTIVLHFDTLDHAQAWLASDTRRALLAQVEPLLVHGDQVEIKTGLEFWFTPPSVQKHAKPYKQFLLTLSAIFPLTILVPWVLRPLFQAVPALGLPGISNLLISALIVGLMTYPNPRVRNERNRFRAVFISFPAIFAKSGPSPNA